MVAAHGVPLEYCRAALQLSEELLYRFQVAHFFGGMRRVMDGMGPPDMGTFGECSATSGFTAQPNDNGHIVAGFPQIGGAAKSGGGGLSKFFH